MTAFQPIINEVIEAAHLIEAGRIDLARAQDAIDRALRLSTTGGFSSTQFDAIHRFIVGLQWAEMCRWVMVLDIEDGPLDVVAYAQHTRLVMGVQSGLLFPSAEAALRAWFGGAR